MTTTIRKGLAGLVAGGAIFTLSACGTSTDDMEDTLTSAFEQAGLADDKAEDVAECMAPKLDDQLSDDDKDVLVDTDTDVLAEGQADNDMSDDGVNTMAQVASQCFDEVGVSLDSGANNG